MTPDSKVSDVDLLPCPFCGGEAEMEEIGNDRTPKRRIIVKCKRCRAEKRHGAIRFDMAWLRKTAIEDWNTRANQQPSAQTLPVEAMQHAVDSLEYRADDVRMMISASPYQDSSDLQSLAEQYEQSAATLRALLPQSPDTMRKG